jgi:hypothetical protein
MQNLNELLYFIIPKKVPENILTKNYMSKEKRLEQV